MPDFAQAVQGAVGQPASVRIGTVASLDPLVVSAQGVPFEDVGVLRGFTPRVGDSVVLLGQCSEAGSDPASWVALGAAQSAPLGYQAGVEPISFTALTSFTRVVVFPQPFTDSVEPNVHLNINSGAGATAQWHARAINITSTQFTIFVFTAGGASTWSNVQVAWSAFPQPTA